MREHVRDLALRCAHLVENVLRRAPAPKGRTHSRIGIEFEHIKAGGGRLESFGAGSRSWPREHALMDGSDNCEMFPRYFLRVRCSRKLFHAPPSPCHISPLSFSYRLLLLRVTLYGRRCVTRRGIIAAAPNVDRSKVGSTDRAFHFRRRCRVMVLLMTGLLGRWSLQAIMRVMSE